MNSLIIITDIVEKLILITLFGLSVWSVSIMIDRRRYFKKEEEKGLEHTTGKSLREMTHSEIRAWAKTNQTFAAKVLSGAFESMATAEGIDRAVASYVKSDRQQLEKGLAILATLGANAPFIGLFGTVLGIIRAFAYIGSQSGSAAVMSGVSQALYATAIGLFVAIPAVVGFNFFSLKAKRVLSTIESVRDLYVAKRSGEDLKDGQFR